MAETYSTRGAGTGGLRNRVFLYGFVLVLVFQSVLPFLWIFKMSIIPKRELFTLPPTIVPQAPTIDHYVTVFGNPAFRMGLLNSVIIAGATTAISLLVGSLAAYAIARLGFRFKSTVMTLILALAFFPAVSIIAPLFVEFTALDLMNTYLVVITTDTVFALPLTIWILVAFFKELPQDLEDAAKLDGATTLQAFSKVIVPLAAPGVFTAAILTFIFAWNEFLFANTFLFDAERQPVSVVIPNFATIYTTDYGAQAAASVVVTVPLVVLVLIFQRRIVAGLTVGAVKG